LIELKAREGEREGSALVSNRAMKGGEGGTYLPPCLTLRPGVYRCIRESVLRRESFEVDERRRDVPR
jgi:hypothetical protein